MKITTKKEVRQITGRKLMLGSDIKYLEMRLDRGAEVSVLVKFDTWSLVYFGDHKKFAFAMDNSELAWS